MKGALNPGLIVPLALILLGCSEKAKREFSGADAPSLPRPLWAEMQQAVLQTQDTKKVEAILRAGFDVNSPIGCGTFSAVDGAVNKGDREMLRVLLKDGARPTGRALVAAAFSVNPDTAYAMTHQLIAAGADANSRGPDGETALKSACYRGHTKVFELLLGQPRVDLNAADRSGDTPLMEAVRQGHADIVQRLLDKGADFRLVNDRRETATTIAAAKLQERRNILELVSAEPAVVPVAAPNVTLAH